MPHLKRKKKKKISPNTCVFVSVFLICYQREWWDIRYILMYLRHCRNKGTHNMSDNTPHNVFCVNPATQFLHTNNIAPHSLLWPRFVISFMPHLSSESMHKSDEYVPLYSEGGNHAVMQLSSIAPSNSIRSLFNNNLMLNVWGRVLSVSIVPYTGKKKTNTHTIQLEAALLDFCPVE